MGKERTKKNKTRDMKKRMKTGGYKHNTRTRCTEARKFRRSVLEYGKILQSRSSFRNLGALFSRPITVSRNHDQKIQAAIENYMEIGVGQLKHVLAFETCCIGRYNDRADTAAGENGSDNVR